MYMNYSRLYSVQQGRHGQDMDCRRPEISLGICNQNQGLNFLPPKSHISLSALKAQAVSLIFKLIHWWVTDKC